MVDTIIHSTDKVNNYQTVDGFIGVPDKTLLK